MAMVKHSKRTVRTPCKQCGSQDLYWYHDTEKEGKRHFCKAHGSWNWTLANRDGTVHQCQTGQEPGDTDRQEERPEPSAAPPAPAAPPDDAEALIQALRERLANPRGTVTMEMVDEAIKSAVAGIQGVPLRIEVKRPDGSVTALPGTAHKALPDVLIDLQAGENVMMVGPAGTGKSKIAWQCAEALGVPFYEISLSPQTSSAQIIGYMQAAGQYVRSLFRESFEKGGVFHFDEFDNGNASVLCLINAALANGHMAFPDGMVTRHRDFRCVASANTFGRGADRLYVGRQALDAATLDRFTVEEIEVDLALEEALCRATGLEEGKLQAVLGYVRELRKSAEDQRMPLIFGPRASVGTCKLLAVGKPAKAAFKARIRKGTSDTDWQKVSRGITEPRI